MLAAADVPSRRRRRRSRNRIVLSVARVYASRRPLVVLESVHERALTYHICGTDGSSVRSKKGTYLLVDGKGVPTRRVR